MILIIMIDGRVAIVERNQIHVYQFKNQEELPILTN